MYVPTFQGLTATDIVRAAAPSASAQRYPFDVPHRTFYRARNAIYHLFRALRSPNRPLIVLAPDYNSGNEILALEAAGASVRYFGVGIDGRVDVREIERLCDLHHPDAIYVIHYLGWPQPIGELAELCRARGLWLVEDCALALLSEHNDRPLGAFGQWSVFCLYKTLPLPNGACLAENHGHLSGLDGLRLRLAGLPSVLGRTAELMVRNLRSRSGNLGAAVESVKRAAGRAARTIDVPMAKIGDIGFDLAEADLAMSDLSTRLMKRLDFDDIRARRVSNYQRLAQALGGKVTPLHADLPTGVCPLFFPILVEKKRETAEALRARGVDALEFWNHGAEGPGASGAPQAERSSCRFLRRHVLGLPIHQDLTPRHLDHVAEQVGALQVRMW